MAGLVARVAILVLTGSAWALRSLQAALADPAFTDPVTLFDWFAVTSFSAALILTALGFLILRENLQPQANTAITCLIVAAAFALAGVANLLEDGAGIDGVGMTFVVTSLTAWVGSFTIAAMLYISPDRSLVFVPLLTALAFTLFELGGGVLALAGWVSFAIFLVRRQGRPIEQP